ncbi:unnamed protein product [Blepharisma stoltei]|uniref:Uncharacterized protein n=1 Tax=Blepharisma stoltei TaxID=1481888 RepID=A0AAU9K0P0_9CILI|nr:unnamed protein product [Blepharisma stoltei]
MINKKLSVKTSYLNQSSYNTHKEKPSPLKADLQRKCINDLIGLTSNSKSPNPKFKTSEPSKTPSPEKPPQSPFLGLGFPLSLSPDKNSPSSSKALTPLPNISSTISKPNLKTYKISNELHQQYFSYNDITPQSRTRSTSPLLKHLTTIKPKLPNNNRDLSDAEQSSEIRLNDTADLSQKSLVSLTRWSVYSKLKKKPTDLDSSETKLHLTSLDLVTPTILPPAFSEKHFLPRVKRHFSPSRLKRLL